MFINHNMLRISIDLEEWYHDMPISDWDHLPSNLSRNTMKLLNLFDSFNIKAKFYCVGYVAKRYPELILEIYRRGHIIGCHSYYHKPLYYHNQFSFEEDLSKSTNVISEIIEDKPIYYRLPMFSYNHEPFFYPLLKKYGYKHDSSIQQKYFKYDFSSIVKKYSSNDFIIEPIKSIRIFYTYLPTGGNYFYFVPFKLLYIHFSQNNELYLHIRDIYNEYTEADSYLKKINYIYTYKNSYTKFLKLLHYYNDFPNK